jgi:hypothetical protein
MSARQLIRAAVALGALLLLWGAFTLFRGQLGEPTGTLSLPRLSPDDVGEIEMAGPADTVRLVRGPDGWTVNGFAADPAEVRRLLDAIADSTMRSELVARNPASHGRMGVDSAGRRLVVRGGGEVLLDLVLGGPGSGYLSVFARRAGADEVYRLQGGLGGMAGRDAGAWRNRRIAALARDSVGRVAIRRAGAEYVLSREGDAWTVAGAPADTAAVRRLLGALADITALGFATPTEAESLDFARPDRRLTVVSRGVDTLLDLLVDSTAAGFRARRADRSDVFQLDFWRVNELTPAVESLRASGS